jgi:hypothetical protein
MKKARYERETKDPSSSSGKRKSVEDEGNSSPDDMLDVSEGPKILSDGEYDTCQTSDRTSHSHSDGEHDTRQTSDRTLRSHSQRPPKRTKGILRKDVPIKKVYESDAPYTDYVIRKSGNRLVLLGVRYGNPPKKAVPPPTSSPSTSTPSTVSRRPRSRKRRARLEFETDLDSMTMLVGTSWLNQPDVDAGQSSDSGFRHTSGASFSTSPLTSIPLLNWIGSLLHLF